MKTCTKCNESKELHEFDVNKTKKSGYKSWCKRCVGSYNKQYYEQSKDKLREHHRKWHAANKDKIKHYREVNKDKIRQWHVANKEKAFANYINRKYGLSLEQYTDMIVFQDFSCALCKQSFEQESNRKLICIDHCHKTGKVRELLCNACNSGLGYFNDNPEILTKAAEYIKKHALV